MTEEIIKNLVSLLVCIKPDEKTQNKIIDLIRGTNIDWSCAYEFAHRHKIVSIIYKNIYSSKALIPSSAKIKFKNFYVANSIHNLQLASVLYYWLKELNDNGIDALPFKGPVLAETAYGDISLRSFSDVDVLIKKTDMVKAWHLFEKSGFRASLKLSDSQKLAYAKTEDHIAFSMGIITIEVHWEITGMYLARPITFDLLAPYFCSIDIKGKKIKTLSNEILVPYLCIHGTKDGWLNVEQVFAISEIIRRDKKFDWQKAMHFAKKYKCRNIFLIGLNLSMRIFNIELPDCILLKIGANKKLQGHTELIHSKFIAFPENPKLDKISDRFDLFHLDIRDSVNDKILYLVRLVFSPTEKEWYFFPVPAYLSFILYLLRPIRLVLYFCFRRVV